MATAVLALIVGLDGPAAAKRLIDGGSIRPSSITGVQIRNGSLAAADFSPRAIAALRRLPAGSVGAAQLGAGAVTPSAVLPNAIGAAAIADGAVQQSKLADGAVGASALAQGSVTSSKVADGAIGSAAIADGSLTTRDIAAFTGTVEIDFASFAPGSCQVAELAPSPAGGGQAQIADDVVSASPAAGWPDPIVVTAKAGAGNKLRIVACYVAPPGDQPLDPPPTMFRYVTFDSP
jgi:hypothetical protein